jgi:hypothetical protein
VDVAIADLADVTVEAYAVVPSIVASVRTKTRAGSPIYLVDLKQLGTRHARPTRSVRAVLDRTVVISASAATGA